MKARKLLIIIICCTTILLFGCSTKQADTDQEKVTVSVFTDYPHYPTINDLAEKATFIIEGMILDSRIEEFNDDLITNDQDEDSNRQPFLALYTVYTVQISDVYKGFIEIGEMIEVRQIGGSNDYIVVEAMNEVELLKNKKYVLFLDKYEGFPAMLLNPIQAAYIYKEIENQINPEMENKEVLVKVHDENDLNLTIEDLKRMKKNY